LFTGPRISPPGKFWLCTFAYPTPERMIFTTALKSPGVTSWGLGPTMSAAVIVRVTVPPDAGHGGVPAGPFPRLVHKKNITPPVVAGAPKWTCDWVAGLDKAVYVRV